MADKIKRVLDFVDCWHRLDLGDALSRVSSEIVFQPDLKSDPVRGKDAVGALWAQYMQQIAQYDAQLLSCAETGDVVFIERVETLSTPDGRTMVLPIVGVFELDDAGLIAAWRDYWDTGMAAPPPAA